MPHLPNASIAILFYFSDMQVYRTIFIKFYKELFAFFGDKEVDKSENDLVVADWDHKDKNDQCIAVLFFRGHKRHGSRYFYELYRQCENNKLDGDGQEYKVKVDDMSLFKALVYLGIGLKKYPELDFKDRYKKDDWDDYFHIKTLYDLLYLFLKDGIKNDVLADKFARAVKDKSLSEAKYIDTNDIKEIDVTKTKTKFTAETSRYVENQMHLNTYDLGSALVDQLIDEYSKLMDTRNRVDQILSKLKEEGKSIEIANIGNWIVADEFLKVRSIIEYYRKVSVYYKNDRLNVPYLCNNDCLYITYWYNNFFAEMFQANNSDVWTSLRDDICSLKNLVDKINRLYPNH